MTRLLVPGQRQAVHAMACKCPLSRPMLSIVHPKCAHHQAPNINRICCNALASSIRKSSFLQRTKSKPCVRKSHVACTASSTSSATGKVLRKGTGSEVRWGTYVSESFDFERAIDEAVAGILNSIGEDSQPEIAAVFISSKHAKHFSNVIPYLRQKLPSLKNIFGCSGYGVLGGAASGPKEVVDDFGLSLSLGILPGVSVTLTHTLRSAIPSEDAAPDAWASFVGLPDARDKNTSFFILCDHSFQHWDKIVEGLDYAFHQSRTLGGQLSLGPKNRSRALFCWSADAEARVAEARRLVKEAREASESPEGGESGGGWLSKLASFIGVNGDDSSDGIDDFPMRGLYQYGAIIMGIQGDVTFDILPHEGFSFMSEKTFVVEEVYGNVIVSVREEGAPINKRITPCEMLVQVLEPTIRKRVAEAQENEPNVYGVLHEVFPDIAVAVAPSSSTLNRDNVELEDFSLLAVSGVDGDAGHMELMSINNQQLSAGQRLRLVTVDPEAVTDDLRQRMLSYKRRELQDVMSGNSLPPAFGALLLSNQAYNQDQGSESTSTVFNYMPVPTSGVLLSSQFATDKNNVTKITHAGVLAIMRAGGRGLSLAEVTDMDVAGEVVAAGSNVDVVAATKEDVAIEGAAVDVDAAATNVDAAATNVDAAATNVDAAATNVDAAATNVDAAATNVDAAATNVDAAAANVDVAAANVDTAASTDVDVAAANVEGAAKNLDVAAANGEVAATNVGASDVAATDAELKRKEPEEK